MSMSHSFLCERGFIIPTSQGCCKSEGGKGTQTPGTQIRTEAGQRWPSTQSRPHGLEVLGRVALPVALNNFPPETDSPWGGLSGPRLHRLHLAGATPSVTAPRSWLGCNIRFASSLETEHLSSFWRLRAPAGWNRAVRTRSQATWKGPGLGWKCPTLE